MGAGGLSELGLGFCFSNICLVSWTEGDASEDVDGEEESMTEIFDKLQHCFAFTLSEGKGAAGAAEREGEPSADILLSLSLKRITSRNNQLCQ